MANLLAVRSIARRREVSIRTALGASRGRIARQLVLESLLLAAAGLVAGIAIAYGGVRALVALLPAEGLVATIEPNLIVLGFGIGLTLAIGLLLGVLPAMRASRIDLRSTLNSDSAGSMTGGTRFGARHAFVIVQVAFSVVMLMGAGLFIRSLLTLSHTDAGVRTHEILQMAFTPQEAGYTPGQLQQFYHRVQAGVLALPGVEAAGYISTPLLSGSRGRVDIYPAGYLPREGEDVNSVYEEVSPGSGVLHRTLTLVAIGVVIGMAAALPLSRFVTALLFRATATDLDLLITVAVSMTVIGLTAVALPAWRAARTNPLTAMRSEVS